MKIIRNPDGTISLSRLSFWATWLVVMGHYLLDAFSVVDTFDAGAAAVLLGGTGASYVSRKYQQSRFGAQDPRVSNLPGGDA